MILHDDTYYIIIMMVLQCVLVTCIFHYVVMKLCGYTPIFYHTVQERIHKLLKGGG